MESNSILNLKKKELIKKVIFDEDICYDFTLKTDMEKCFKIQKKSKTVLILSVIGLIISTILLITGIIQLFNPIYESSNSWSYFFMVGMILLTFSILLYLSQISKITDEKKKLAKELI